MSGSVPSILWYLLAFFAFAVFPLAMVATIHRQRMKALEILRSYAEKGGEPPPGVTDLLQKQMAEPDQQWKSTPRGSMLHTFMIHLSIACVMGCIAWWRFDAGPPRWALYIAVGSTVFFAVSAIGFLAAALKSPAK
jgi:hypothetical protein